MGRPENGQRAGRAPKNLGIDYRIEWYAGTDHGFVFVDRGSLYYKASAEKHYERLLSLFERNLKRKTL